MGNIVGGRLLNVIKLTGCPVYFINTKPYNLLQKLSISTVPLSKETHGFLTEQRESGPRTLRSLAELRNCMPTSRGHAQGTSGGQGTSSAPLDERTSHRAGSERPGIRGANVRGRGPGSRAVKRSGCLQASSASSHPEGSPSIFF